MSDNNYVIETKELTHTYPNGFTALNGISIKIKENEIVSIVGQNGSGKTTLVRHFNGLLRPTTGKYYLSGEETDQKTVGELSHDVGYVFQNPNHQIFSTTVLDELKVGPKNFGFTEEEMENSLAHVIELLGLEDELEKHPLTIDYTTKKIVTIASVLAFNPKVLIMDEPTGGLDQEGRRILTKIISLMKEIGHTVIIISHDMDYVAENSERVIVMANGNVIDDGTPDEIFAHTEILAEAQIEPPQITQLDGKLNPNSKLSMSVDDFVEKLKKEK